MKRSRLAVGVARLLVGMLPWGMACAQDSDWPRQPIKIISPWPAGGVVELLSRTIGEPVSRELGQPVIVESRAGAATNIGSESVARAAPDGYTLLMAGSVNAVNMTLFPQLKYDIERDFAPIALVAYTPMVLLANPSVPTRNLAELVALAKTKPGELTIGLGGIAGPSHLATASFERAASVQFLKVPYKGAAPALVDIMGGQVQLLITNVAAAAAYVKAGKLKALAVSGKRRNPALPEVPTFIEQGMAGFDPSGWYGLVAPRQAPAPVVAKLVSVMSRVLANRTVIERLSERGVEVAAPGTPAQFASLIYEEIERQRRNVMENNIKLE